MDDYIYMGYIYLIEDNNNHTYKIGVTRNNNSNRLKKLQTGNSTKLKPLYTYQTDYPFRLESMLHKKFSEYKILNEWYELPTTIVDDFIKYCEQLNSIIISLKDNHFFSKKLK